MMDDYIDHLLDCWAHPTPDGCTDTHRCETAETLWAAAIDTSLHRMAETAIKTAVDHMAETIHADTIREAEDTIREAEDTIREATEELRAQEAEETLDGF